MLQRGKSRGVLHATILHPRDLFDTGIAIRGIDELDRSRGRGDAEEDDQQRKKRDRLKLAVSYWEYFQLMRLRY